MQCTGTVMELLSCSVCRNCTFWSARVQAPCYNSIGALPMMLVTKSGIADLNYGFQQTQSPHKNNDSMVSIHTTFVAGRDVVT